MKMYEKYENVKIRDSEMIWLEIWDLVKIKPPKPGGGVYI